MPSRSLLAGGVACLSMGLTHTALGQGAAPPQPCPFLPPYTYSASDCPNNSCYYGPPNGCGSESTPVPNPDLIPDEWPAGVDFTQACNNHDNCYASPGAMKQQCDDQYLRDMLMECEQSLRCTDLPIIGEQCFDNPQDNPLWEPCSGLANAYYGFVDQFAEEPFQNNQQEAMRHAEQCMAQAGGMPQPPPPEG